ncbi:MAG: hypothetical protein KDK07_13205 [Bauldia sp.]|nr:hypothetical protein [Bauldia sp.]
MIRPLTATMLAVLPCGGAAAAVPPATFLDAFLTACLNAYDDPAARNAVIAAAGWRPVADDADPMLAAVMEASRDALASARDEEGYDGAVAAFGQTLGGADAYLVATEFDMPAGSEPEIDLLGCYLYDFAADGPLDASRITARFDVPPAEIENQPGIIVAEVWNIETLPGVWELRSTFIPADGPAAAITGFSGRVLSVTATWDHGGRG